MKRQKLVSESIKKESKIYIKIKLFRNMYDYVLNIILFNKVREFARR